MKVALVCSSGAISRNSTASSRGGATTTVCG